MIDMMILKGLFCQHYSEMKHLARTMLYADEEAEDVVHDVFVRLMQSRLLPSEEKARSYLMTAVCRGCIDRIRQKSLREQVRNLYWEEAETDLQHIEERMEMLDAICDYAENRLEEPHRTIFRLRFKEGMTLKEIAQQLDMNLKTVFKYLSLSITTVKEQFRQ